VALHGCTQNANDYYTNAGWKKYADLWHFALVFPEQKSANNSTSCFNWFETGDTARGGGEALSIKQMVDYAVTTYGVNSARVYVTGLSAGGAMTAVMLATYPDVFAGGAIMAGLPYRCATSTTSAYSCMNPGVDKTPAAWGDLVRAAYSGYTGPRPRVAIWHGTSDTTVAPANATELRDQWTNVLGVSQTPSSTASLPGGTSLSNYQDKVKVYLVSGMPHATPVDPGSATEQCGTAGTYYKDTICSTYYQALDWGLGTGATPTQTASPTRTASPAPTTPGPTSGPCVRATNYAHVGAGRAHTSGGYTYANGSNQNMGLYNVFTTHGLRQTGANYWVIDDTAC
jgi:poly(hydroxyalkanoate) depolymerase family esterase